MKSIQKRVVQTNAVNSYLEEDESHHRASYVMQQLIEHLNGKDIGVPPEDAQLNVLGRKNSTRVMNVFSFPACSRAFWIITEAWGDEVHEYTTVLFPEDY